MELLMAMGAYFIQGITTMLLSRFLHTRKSTQSFFAIATKSDVPVPEPKKEVRNYGIITLVCVTIAIAIGFFLVLPTFTKVALWVAGVATGFLVAIIKFDHWNELMEHLRQELLKQTQPTPPKNQILGIGLLVLWLFSHWLPIHVRNIVGADVTWLGMGALGLVLSAFGSGYYLEHLILYWLNGSDSQLPTPDDSL